jgi:hypothetical protein
MAPGYHPAQLVYLTLEFMCVLGFGQGRLTCDLPALSFMATLLDYTQRQVWNKVTAAEASVMKQYAEGCVECIWLSLDKQLQRAAGVAEAELEATAHSRQMQQQLRLAAAAAEGIARMRASAHGRAWKWSCLQMQRQGFSWSGMNTATACLAHLPYIEVSSSASWGCRRTQGA